MGKVTRFEVIQSENGGFVVELNVKVGDGFNDVEYLTYTFKSVAQVIKALKEAFPKPAKAA